MYTITTKPTIKLAKFDQVYEFYTNPIQFKIINVESRDGLNWKIVGELICDNVYTPPFTYWGAHILDEDDPNDINDHSVKYSTWEDLENFDPYDTDPMVAWQGSQSEHPHGLGARWEAFLINQSPYVY